MKLKVISELRLKNPGKCKSCKWASHWTEYGASFWDCTHKLFEELPENDDYEEMGTKQICPLWEPENIIICKKHELCFEKHGCGECEYESLIEAENSATEYWQNSAAEFYEKKDEIDYES
jgi:hypothetical protein